MNYGDGIILASTDAQNLMTATVSKNSIFNSERAGVSTFGANVTLKDNSMLCSGFDLDGEEKDGVDFTFNDGGGNHCGCGVVETCRASTVGLQAPKPIGGP